MARNSPKEGFPTLKNEPEQLSLYSILYDKIPKNHILKKINSAVDFRFISGLIKDSYSRYYGRPAKEPEMMAKLLILEYMYTLSDIQVIEHTSIKLQCMTYPVRGECKKGKSRRLLTEIQKES